jgi:hypothetical protein
LALPVPIARRNLPGSLSGLPRGRLHRDRAQLCARSSSTSPERAEALPDDAGVVFAFYCKLSTSEGA